MTGTGPTESIMNRGVEGRGVYAGGLSFLLTTIAGALGAILGGSLGWLDNSNTTYLDCTARAFCFAVGTGASMAGGAAVIGLLLGSHLARSFHWIFLTSLVWLAAMATLIFVSINHTLLGIPRDPSAQLVVPVGCGAIVLGAGLGVLLGVRCDGFTHRARVRSGIGTLLGILGTAGVIVVVFGLVLSSRAGYLITPGILCVVAGGGIGGMIGALAGADRHKHYGFAVLEPISFPDADPR